MRVTSWIIQNGITPRRQLSEHLALWRWSHQPIAYELNIKGYSIMFRHSALNLHPARELAQVDLTTNLPLVYAIAFISFFHIHLLIFPHSCFIPAAWKLIWYMVLVWLVYSRLFLIWSCLISLPSLSANLNMVRRQGVSRRGRTTRNRGWASQFAPQNIVPLASVSPSSPPSDHGRPFPHNSFQTTYFKFHSRLNKPILSASITVIFTEEEDKPRSSAHTTVSQSLEDNILHEDVADVMFKGDNLQEEGIAPEAPQPPVDCTEHNLPVVKPEHSPGGILNLEISLGDSDVGEEDIAVVTGEGSPSQVEGKLWTFRHMFNELGSTTTAGSLSPGFFIFLLCFSE